MKHSSSSLHASFTVAQYPDQREITSGMNHVKKEAEMFNPALVLGAWTVVLLGIAMWAMATQEGEDMESEDFSYFSHEQKKDAPKHRQSA